MTEVDVAIVGGGCAGISLAARLAVEGGPRCIVLEARAAFDNDRAWSFWDSGESRHWGITPDAKWDRWALRLHGDQVVHASPGHRYVSVSARSFYDAQLARIASSQNVQVRMNCRPRLIGHDGVLSLEDGTGIRARAVFDARRLPPATGTLVQHFEGWEIEARGPVFDDGIATLMDFDVDQTCGIHFVYMLPFSATRALVEATVLSLDPWPAAHYGRSLVTYLRKRFGLAEDDFKVLRRETAQLPMERNDADETPGSLRLGTSSGASKLSSGYAFPFIQAQSDAWAGSILRGARPPVGSGRSRVLSWMDRVFVDVLKADPEQAPALFRSLFEGTTGQQFARFMMEKPSIGDLAAVIRSVPTVPFLKAAMMGVR